MPNLEYSTPASPKPSNEFVVYCDESRHNASPQNRFMGIGGLWVPRPYRDRIRRALDTVASQHRLGEAKWSKVSRLSLPGYKALIDTFVDEPLLRFRVTLVEHEQIDYAAFHHGSPELGFYRFYFRMLRPWIEAGGEYIVLLDHRVNSERARHTELRRVLERSTRQHARIRRVETMDSRESRLAQLADILTGAITAAACGVTPGTAKDELQAHFAARLGRRNLADPSMSWGPSKVNVFLMDLARSRKAFLKDMRNAPMRGQPG